jgi:hypothetical protein
MRTALKRFRHCVVLALLATGASCGSTGPQGEHYVLRLVNGRPLPVSWLGDGGLQIASADLTLFDDSRFALVVRMSCPANLPPNTTCVADPNPPAIEGTYSRAQRTITYPGVTTADVSFPPTTYPATFEPSSVVITFVESNSYPFTSPTPAPVWTFGR